MVYRIDQVNAERGIFESLHLIVYPCFRDAAVEAEDTPACIKSVFGNGMFGTEVSDEAGGFPSAGNMDFGGFAYRYEIDITTTVQFYFAIEFKGWPLKGCRHYLD